jgi:oligoendopeptidase F
VTSTYPFNPNDWNTITPLFNALLETSLSEKTFFDWLDQWNTLDITVYDAWTTLKRPAYFDKTDFAAEKAYQLFTQEIFSTYLGITQSLIEKALAFQPAPPLPVFAQLWRRWHNQRSLYNPKSLPIQAEISRLEGRYREISRNYEWLPENPNKYWLVRRSEINDLMMQLLRLRRELAQVSGVQTFLDYRWHELNKLDYSIEDCQSFHRTIERVAVPHIARLRDTHLVKHSIQEVDDTTRLSAGVERILSQVDPSFGSVFRKLREGYLDLGIRPNKVSAIESWFFPRVGIPYLHVDSTYVPSILHESGHGIHEYLSFQKYKSLWNFSGPEEFQEFAAMTMDMLCWPYYAQERGGLYSIRESANVQHNVLRFYFEELANSTMHDAFEHWVYGEAPVDVTPSDFDTKWLDLIKRFKPWEDVASNEIETMTGWQRWTWSLFRMPLYMIAYATAIIGACQMGRLLERDRFKTISNYRDALALGNTEPLPTLFRVSGIAFPFEETAVKEAMTFMSEQLSKTTNSS